MEKSGVVMLDRRRKVAVAASIVGFFLCVIIGLAEHSSWLQGLCGAVTGGCQESLSFTLLKMPLWLLGILFYVVLGAALLRQPRVVVWIVAVGGGVEAALVYRMVTTQILCVYCLVNLAVMMVVVGFTFRKSTVWQFFSAALFALLVFLALTAWQDGPAATPALPKEDVAALIGDRAITFEELDIPNAAKIGELEKTIYRMRMDRLNAIIGDILLEMEAASKGVTVDQMLQDALPPSSFAASDEDVDKYAEENQERLKGWTGTEDELKTRIRTHIEQQRRYEEIKRFATSLRPKYGVSILLSEPAEMKIKIDLEGSPSIGPPGAPVTVVQFSDYRCPACKKAHNTVLGLKEAYKGNVRWVFKDFPLKRHPDAHISAEAARCAGEQGKFWEYQDVLYRAEGELTSQNLVELAGGAGLGKEPFSQCLNGGKYKEAVEKDIRNGRQVGVDRTPCFFINGRMITGSLSAEAFKAHIDAELKKTAGEKSP